jgi:hypothetical protein
MTRLGRERQGASAAESAGQLGEDRQVGVEPDPIEPTDSEGDPSTSATDAADNSRGTVNAAAEVALPEASNT